MVYTLQAGHQENPHFTFHAFFFFFFFFTKKHERAQKKHKKKSQVLGFPSDLAFCAFLVVFFFTFSQKITKKAEKSRKSKIWVFLMSVIISDKASSDKIRVTLLN